MEIDQELKCNIEIFKSFKPIVVNDELIITQFNIGNIEREAESYFSNSCGFDVKKYLPGAAVTSKIEATEKIYDFMNRHLALHAICYTIRLIKTNEPVGYILLNSPISEYNLNEWVIDFWVASKYQSFGIMTKSVPCLFKYLSTMKVNVIYSQINKNNNNAIKLIDKLQFTDITEFCQIDNNQKLFGVKLY